MKRILILLTGLLLYSCQQEIGLRIPEQLAVANSSSIYLGAKKISVQRSRQLIENSDLSEYTSSSYYEKLDNNPFFSHMAYKFSWGSLSTVIMSRNVDNQDISLDTTVVELVKIFQKNYGKDYTIYQRNEGLMKIPALCWYIPDKGYVTLYYVPCRIFQRQYRPNTFTSNNMSVEFSTTRDKWLERTVRYTRSNLGLDNL